LPAENAVRKRIQNKYGKETRKRLFLSMESAAARPRFVKNRTFFVLLFSKMEVEKMMELMEQKGTEEERKLPKNIRQIGEPGQGVKVLIEDYAYTYLHQLAEENLTCMKTAVLVGRTEEPGRIYVQGALEVKMGQEQKSWFSNEHWRDIFQNIQNWFEGLEVVGWFLSNPGFPAVLTEELRSLHKRHFPGTQYVFFQMDVLENEEVLYQRGENGLTPLCGYYIYYEKNDRMQAYMSQQRGGVGIEPEGILKDQAAARFRNVMQEKKEQNAQKKTLAFLYTACTFLVMVILVIGVTMINNYDRMANMENALNQISENLDEPAPKDLEEAALEENQQALELAEAQPAEEDTEAADASAGEDTETDASAGENTETAETSSVEDAEEASTEVAEASAGEEPEEETQEVMSQAVQEPVQYQVQVGDTLLGICRDRYGNEDMVNEICELNGLDDSDKIYVGQTIVLP